MGCNNKLNVLVIGAGMYVAGRGTSTYGTVLPALNELYRKDFIDNIYVAATSSKSIHELIKRVTLLRNITGSGIKVTGFPHKGENLKAYKQAIYFCKPDCAIVVVPDQLHYSIVFDLIKQGIHTLVAKPLVPTVQEAKRLINFAKQKNIYAAVEFHKRYDEANMKLKDVIKSGRIGDILYVNVEFSQKRLIPLKIFKEWAAKTNIFQYLGVHYVDIIYFATKAKPLRVIATGQKRLLRQFGINNYDAVQTMIEWRSPTGNKFISNILTNWIDPNTTSAMSDQKIMVVGTMGRYQSNQKDRGVQIVTESTGVEDINPYFTQSYPSLNDDNVKIFKGYGIESITQFCKDVLDIKEGNAIPADFKGRRPTFKDCLVSTAVIEAVNQSLKSNSSWIKIKL